MRLIWATRGRTWGFRFLRRGGLTDPLPTYSLAFAEFEGMTHVWNRSGDMTALRFEDPLGRKDRAGRVVPHDFVVFGDLPAQVNSVSSGINDIWPIVEAEYARNYDSLEPHISDD
ncbi:hypothetical protein ASE64_09920 [Agreia sp. Leaf210]|nr:hypothetical protein ASE64_09920 [Agreia sp. Leaf210]